MIYKYYNRKKVIYYPVNFSFRLVNSRMRPGTPFICWVFTTITGICVLTSLANLILFKEKIESMFMTKQLEWGTIIR